MKILEVMTEHSTPFKVLIEVLKDMLPEVNIEFRYELEEKKSKKKNSSEEVDDDEDEEDDNENSEQIESDSEELSDNDFVEISESEGLIEKGDSNESKDKNKNEKVIFSEKSGMRI